MEYRLDDRLLTNFIISISFIWSINQLSNIFNSVETSVNDALLWNSSKRNCLSSLVDRYIRRKRTHMSCCIKIFSSKLEGSQLIRFLTMCNNMEDFHEVTPILFKVLREKQQYRQISQTSQSKNYRQPGNTLDSIWAALKCKSRRCQCCLYLNEKSHSGNDDFDFLKIVVVSNCLSKNIIYIIEYKACGDKYAGETGRCLKDRMFN